MMARSIAARRPMPGRPGSRRRMHGLSLIEILVSVVILGIGLLGVAAMQSLALRGGQSSLEASQAVMQDLASTRRFHPVAMAGGMSTRSASAGATG